VISISEALRTLDLGKTYYSEQQPVVALKNINITLEEGELFCLLGPSGCGKSTLLRCIAGFEQPTKGEIIVEGQTINKPGPDRTMIFQGFDQLLPWKTVLGNVEYPLKVNRVGSRIETREKAEHFISLVDLQHFKDYYPHQLSGGMKQKVAIARALALKPKVLLMDEPFASLDAQTRNSLQAELIRVWAKFKITIVFITHNIEEAIILGTRTAVMSAQPGIIKEIVENHLERPRLIGYPGFSEMWSQLHNLLDVTRQH
jgi:NitT/TauT family transport system ATP-binding protein